MSEYIFPRIFPSQVLAVVSPFEESASSGEDISKFLKHEPISCKQVHGNSVCKVMQRTNILTEADALITNLVNIPLLIRTADCMALMVYDSKNNAIANIHAGWRGLATHIIPSTFARLNQEYGTKAEDCLVFIAPALQVCCAEFSDPYTELPVWMHPYIERTRYVHLQNCALAELEGLGVLKQNIECSEICTKCSLKYLPSHRRDKTKERIHAVIMLQQGTPPNLP